MLIYIYDSTVFAGKLYDRIFSLISLNILWKLDDGSSAWKSLDSYCLFTPFSQSLGVEVSVKIGTLPWGSGIIR